MDWNITTTILFNIAMLIPIGGVAHLAVVTYKDMAVEAK